MIQTVKKHVTALFIIAAVLLLIITGGSMEVCATTETETDLSDTQTASPSVTFDISTRTITEPEHEYCPSARFTDLNTDSWYHEGIDYVLITGMMNGVSSDRFDPDSLTSRAMIVTILYRLEGKPTEDYLEDPAFTDLESDSWYETAVRWAAGHRIISGYSEKEFGPHDPITREQMAAILYRYAEYKGVLKPVTGDVIIYEDQSSISEYALTPIFWTIRTGLIRGLSSTTLAPQENLTRAQTATVIMRFDKAILAENNLARF